MFSYKSIDEAYVDIIKRLFATGASIERRQQVVLENFHEIICLENPRHRIVQNPMRRLSVDFLVGEFFWILSGRNDVEFISAFNKKIKDYSDDGKTLYGAYGLRLKSQWNNAIRALQEDPLSRQVVLPIIQSVDVGTKTKDFPCNNLLHFWSSDGNTLNLTVYVRSQDMFLGFPYDVFHWTLLLESMAIKTKMTLGKYYHIMQNCHLYERDRAKLLEIVNLNRQFLSVPMTAIPCSVFDIQQQLYDNALACQMRAVPLFVEQLVRSSQTDVWTDFIRIAYKRFYPTAQGVDVCDLALKNIIH